MNPFRLLFAIALLLPFSARAGVQINEFMYQPASLNTNEEWIEIWNNDTNAVNLQGWRFTSGISFTFSNAFSLAPGAYLVIAANTNTFGQNYPTMAATGQVVGNWSGTLGNNGETIRLEDAAGEKVDEVTYGTEGDWAYRIRGNFINGFRGWEWYCPHDGTDKSVELINPRVKKNSGQNWAASIPLDGTPGALNSVNNTNTAPLILQVAYAPLVPTSTNTIVIQAAIVDPVGAGVNVRLRWRLDANPQGAPFGTTNMFDDGVHGDGAAGDGTYGAVLPAQNNFAIIEFYIEAATTSGKSNNWPAPALPASDGVGGGQVANALLQVDNTGGYTPAPGSAPLYRLLMTTAEELERDAIAAVDNNTNPIDAQMNATLISFDGTSQELRYLCGMRSRGAGSRNSLTGRAVPNQRVNVPNDRPWKGVRAFNLNSQYPHAQIAGYALASRSGLVTENARAVKVRINGIDNANAGGPQYGHYSHTEAPNSDFVDEHFPLDNGGNLYRMSTGSHGAQLSYRGSNFTTYLSNGYLKQNNSSENDWSDLIHLTEVLTFAPAQTYVEDIRVVADVEEWMLYFATFSLTDSMETSFATGRGDDYSAYRGGIDTRFKLLAHDWDTILDQGDTDGNTNRNIWRMVPAVTGDSGGGAAVVLNRFMLHPEFAPIYFATLKRLIDTSFSDTSLSYTLDQALGWWVPGPIVASMKVFAQNRNNYVLSQIPTNLTVASTLSSVNGFPQANTASATIFGRADAIRTRSVLVNGSPATWVAWQARWTNTVALIPGIDRVLIQSLDTNGVEFARTNYDIWYNSGGVTVAGTISTNANWTAAGGPYNVTGTITVPAGVTLTIQPGATLFFASGASMTVNGQLIAQGTDLQHIRFTKVPGGGNWRSLDFINTGNVESRLAYVDFDSCAAFNIGGHVAQMHVNNSRIFIDHCTWANTPAQQYISFDASSFIVQNSVFPTYPWATSAPEMLHGVNGIQVGGYGIFRDNYFGHTYGFNDTIDFTGGQRPGPILQIIGNVFDGAGDDHLDLDSTDAWVEGNIFMHVHRDPSRTDRADDTASAISGGVDVAGQFSEWTVINNLFYDVDHAILNKGSTNFLGAGRFIFVNNTLVHVNKESGAGLTNDIAAFNFTDNEVPLPAPSYGAGAYIANNIIWDAPALLANYNSNNHTVVFENNILPQSWAGPGSNNVVADPRLNLQLISNITNADWATVKAALTPRAGSLTLGNGWGAKYDKGGLNPRGLMIVGEPSETTTATTATLRVLPGGTFNWGTNPYLWGYTHYKWKLDNGAWSAELPITTQPTISLSGLSAGSHTVYVVGKNDAGYYQDDTFVYPTNGVVSAHITASRTWTITSVPGRVQLSEVLAHNTGAVEINNGSPDVIEIFNPGSTSIDLSGMGVTDDPAAAYKFFFPPGTILGVGQYFLLLADSDKDTNYFHLGFGLSQSGDGVYIYDIPARGGVLLDSVVFGVQVPNFSIARFNPHSAIGTPQSEWSLAYPTLGGANLRHPMGDSSRVLINEWLTAHTFGNDFIELYNYDSAPANIGGCYITDTPASAPTMHQFPPLTFVPANGYLVLTPDADTPQGADHLNFKLSPDRGLIALYSPALSLIDLILYGPQSTDISEGRSPDGADSRGFFTQPTPGSPNPGASGCIVTTTSFNLLPMVSAWKYNRSGTDLGTSWRDPAYNDSAWSSGLALFGVEDCACLPFPLNTPFGAYVNTQVVYYFRTTFSVSSNLTGVDLQISDLLDDGAVIFLDGSELTRIGMPGGTITAITLPNRAPGNASLETVSIPNVSLSAGTHSLAVEVHNAITPTSSDIVWGMALDVTKSTTNCPPAALVLNEVMANNKSFTNADGSITDWIELYNPGAVLADMSAMSLTDDPGNSTRWVFPSGVTIAPNSHLVVKFDPGSPATTNFTGGVLNTGFGFDAGGDRVLLFDKPARPGLLDSIQFGLQAPDFTIGRVPNGTGPWVLTLPTEGSVNIAAALGNAALVRINEWMAEPKSGDDWFELFNPNLQPVNISGLYLTDTLNVPNQYVIPNLSFIGTDLRAFVQFFADNAPQKGADHVNFKLNGALEAIGLFARDGLTKIDSVTFTNSLAGVSEGRFPDGASTIIRFPLTPTPADANFLPFNDLYINEVLTHSDLPLEDAIELFNPTATPINIGGWFLSDSQSQPKKYRFPDNTIIQANSFVVVYENQFNATPGLGGSFALSSGGGDNIHLSVADAAGNLTGFRVTEDFGPQANGVSFGKFETSIGYDFVAMTARTFGVDNPADVEEFRTGTGATNASPRVGPVVINEIHYHPRDNGTNDNTLDEFIELYNFATTNVALFDPAAPTNTWHIRNAVDFDFPTNVTLAARSYLLLVGFDPGTNAPLTAFFRSRYGIGAGVPLYGPLKGKLANDNDNIELRRPDSPNANDVPYVLVEKVHYYDGAPWPGAADWNTNGAVGISLQRISPAPYANEPTNWVAGFPTAGVTNGIAVGVRPSFSVQPTNRVTTAGTTVLFVGTSTGAAPLTYQWRFNGIDIPNATNQFYQATNVQYASVGRYSVRVMNPYGVILSTNALLTIGALPEIVHQPQSRSAIAGEAVSFSVGARGAQPLAYQWRKDGIPINGATSTVLTISNVQTNDAAGYTVVIMNSFGSVTSSIAFLAFNTSPVIVSQPQSTSVFVGQDATFSVSAVGSFPLRYQWRFNNGNIGGATNSTLTLLNVQLTASGNYSVVVSNVFGITNSVTAALLVTIPPTITIVANDPSAAESGLNPGQFTIHRTVTSNTAITVGFTIGGTAQNGPDYQPIGSSVFMPVGSTSAVVNIIPIDDTAPEAQETVVLTLNSSASYAIGSPSAATVTILDNDNVVPSANLTAPAGGSVYPVSPTNILLSATASDSDGGVAKVEFFSNATNKIGEVIGSGPYVFTWTNANVGTNILTAVATDVFGATGSSAPVSIYVNAVPTVVITAPADSSSVPQGDVQIAAAASDVQGAVTRVDFFVGGLLLQSLTNAPFTAQMTNAALGSYQTYAIAYDAFGLSAASPLVNFTVVVANTNFADMFAQRGFISGITNFSLATNAAATVEPGEQQHANVGGRSMWLTWTAPAKGVVTIDYLQSSFDTLMAIYTNRSGIAPNVSNIVKVAQNDDSNVVGTNVTRSRVIFTNNIIGQQFHIAADGWRGATGVLQMHLSVSNTSPYITTQPASQTNSIGANATFTVAATGVAPLGYFWRFNGTLIAGANSASYSVNNMQPASNGAYDVIVSNSFGTATSGGARLTVRSAPIITQQPQDQSVAAGANATFSVTAQGGSLVYQWRFNNGNIPGANASTYIRPNVGPSDVGDFTCYITNLLGSVTSASAALSLASPLTVTAVQYSNNVFSGVLSGGLVNRGYAIEVSTNFSEGWAPLTTVSNITGSVTWSDTNSAPRRNYRARLLP